MKETVVEAIQILQRITPAQYELYGEMALPIVATVVSSVFMFLKKLFHINRPAFMFFMVAIASMTAGFSLYLFNVVQGNPFVAGALMPLLTLIAYHFMLRPLVKKYAPKLQNLVANAKLYKRLKLNKTVEDEIPGRRVSEDFSH